jgi:hypothetical protein
MPLPKPRATEDKNTFISRCMADTVMNTEFPDNSQRYAVCLNCWGDR